MSEVRESRATARLVILAVLVALVGGGIFALHRSTQGCGGQTYSAEPAMTINSDHSYQATIKTNRGTIIAVLLPREAPHATNNFVYLSGQCFYNGLTWHRVEDWVVQGGDPTGTGSGGPGYKFADETVHRAYDRGVVAMANSGPNTNGSQFFILKQSRPLPPSYSVFGYVSLGMEVVDKLQKGDLMQEITVADVGTDLPPSPSPLPSPTLAQASPAPVSSPSPSPDLSPSP